MIEPLIYYTLWHLHQGSVTYRSLPVLFLQVRWKRPHPDEPADASQTPFAAPSPPWSSRRIRQVYPACLVHPVNPGCNNKRKDNTPQPLVYSQLLGSRSSGRRSRIRGFSGWIGLCMMGFAAVGTFPVGFYTCVLLLSGLETSSCQRGLVPRILRPALILRMLPRLRSSLVSSLVGRSAMG